MRRHHRTAVVSTVYASHGEMSFVAKQTEASNPSIQLFTNIKVKLFFILFDQEVYNEKSCTIAKEIYYRAAHTRRRLE